jgi:hypothetical protein
LLLSIPDALLPPLAQMKQSLREAKNFFKKIEAEGRTAVPNKTPSFVKNMPFWGTLGSRLHLMGSKAQGRDTKFQDDMVEQVYIWYKKNVSHARLSSRAPF